MIAVDQLLEHQKQPRPETELPTDAAVVADRLGNVVVLHQIGPSEIGSHGEPQPRLGEARVEVSLREPHPVELVAEVEADVAPSPPRYRPSYRSR